MRTKTYREALKLVNKVRKARKLKVLAEFDSYAVPKDADQCAVTRALRPCGARYAMRWYVNFKCAEDAKLASKAWQTSITGGSVADVLLPDPLVQFVKEFDAVGSH